MGLERNVSIEEMMKLGLNFNTAKRLYNLRQIKSVLKTVDYNADTKNKNHKYSKGGYALNRNGVPIDKNGVKLLKFKVN